MAHLLWMGLEALRDALIEGARVSTVGVCCLNCKKQRHVSAVTSGSIRRKQHRAELVRGIFGLGQAKGVIE
jgi:hypothetical protein